jgi:nitroreductase
MGASGAAPLAPRKVPSGLSAGALIELRSSCLKIPQTCSRSWARRARCRLKPDPVPAELIRKILEAGVSAPSGGNMQRWRFLVIRDPKVKQTIGAYYKRAWDEVVSPRYRAGEPAPGTSRERCARMLNAAQYLADHGAFRDQGREALDRLIRS